jgi:hypothetical protein
MAMDGSPEETDEDEVYPGSSIPLLRLLASKKSQIRVCERRKDDLKGLHRTSWVSYQRG